MHFGMKFSKQHEFRKKNPVIAWDIHDKKLQEKAAELNEQQFTALHYTAPGSDLTIGLP